MTKQYFKTLSGEVFSANVEGGQIDGRKLNPTKTLGSRLRSAAVIAPKAGRFAGRPRRAAADGASTRQKISYAMWHLLLHKLDVQRAK